MEIDLVINIDAPYSKETYWHRIGRTGRYGNFGASFIFLTEKDDNFIKESSDIFN